MNLKSLNNKLERLFSGRVAAFYENGSIVVRGSLDKWDDVVAACMTAAKKNSTVHVVNDIVFTGGKMHPCVCRL